MSAAGVTANAWGVRLDTERPQSTRLVDFIAFAAFGFTSIHVPVIGLPANEVMPLLLCAVCLLRPATSRRPVPPWFAAGLLLLAGWMAATSYAHHYTDVRRLLHIALYIVLAGFLASGRIHLPSAARGLAVGLSVSIALAIGGFGQTTYSGRLVGFFGDPNGGGYTMTVLGAVALAVIPPGWLRRALMVLVPIAVILTFSRTTLLALAFSLVWLMFARRTGVVVGATLVTAMVWVVGHIPSQLKAFGPFADRKGSDELRVRIVAQEHADVAQSPLTGSGAGTAHVTLGNDTFFYHSSYLALQREGGIIALIILVGTLLLVFAAAVGTRRDLRNPWLEVGVICVAVCAVNLGEVLLELPAAVAMGALMHHRMNLPSAAELAVTPPGGRHRPPRRGRRPAAATESAES